MTSSLPLAFTIVVVAVYATTAAAAILPSKEPVATSWTCIPTQPDTPLTTSGSVFWRKENCTFSPDTPPLLVVNSIHVDMTASDIKVVPGWSQDASQQLLPIGKMAQTYGDKRNLIAGINGGYFWRVDITPFWVDDVCRGKIRHEAEKPADPEHVNYGIHDGVMMADGVTVGNNCDCWGYSRPAVLEYSPATKAWDIAVLKRGEKVAAGISDAIGAGPNLVSTDPTTGSSFIDIPCDDDNINIHEHAANTAVGIMNGRMIMVTTDGSDECGRLDQTCGLNSHNLASLMKIHFGIAQAMSMDQGGSTTMWVQKATAESVHGDGVVSYAGGGARNVANGLFVQLL